MTSSRSLPALSLGARQITGLVLCALLVLVSPLVGAAGPNGGGGPAWNSLGAAQRQALAPLERDWSAIDPVRKQKWLELASRFDRMSPDERSRVQQRMSDWVRLSAKQRTEARMNFQGAKDLSPQERQARWQAYQSLPEDQRRSLAARAKSSAVKGNTRAAAPSAETKINTVPNPLLEARKPRAVTPGLTQANPGATTNLMSTRPTPPLHQQTGLPKVAATPEFVDSTTLLPQRGPQGAATEPRRKP
ncbi:DUF3106 domain-containing protein [Methylibium sp.]|uniref:DUF3106 domain-containing protein n=1 Tax=Methylibium sp. TaxID=2067992 RepID=UPI003D0E3D43